MALENVGDSEYRVVKRREPETYGLGSVDVWCVVKVTRVITDESVIISRSDDSEVAGKIAKAMNEAEGL